MSIFMCLVRAYRIGLWEMETTYEALTPLGVGVLRGPTHVGVRRL